LRDVRDTEGSVFRDRLSDLRSAVPGATAVCLVAGDGISIESVGGQDLDLEVLAAESVAMARGIASEDRALGIGGTERLEIETNACVLILSRIRDGYFLLLVVGAGHPLGRARFEIRRASPRFVADLL
jgi:predicted regulator of Ras-like GTPase activity (Roadblock/LC7/MglB family)